MTDSERAAVARLVIAVYGFRRSLEPRSIKLADVERALAEREANIARAGAALDTALIAVGPLLDPPGLRPMATTTSIPLTEREIEALTKLLAQVITGTVSNAKARVYRAILNKLGASGV
jgi:hypothetical protein